MKRKRIAAVVSHPIQYQAPLFRELARDPRIDLTVFFENDHGVRASLDPGFGRSIQFDVPLTDGFEHCFLTSGCGYDRTTVALAGGLLKLVRELRRGLFDWVWVHGYSRSVTISAIAAARSVGVPILLRGESTLMDALPASRQLVKDRIMPRLISACSAFGYIGKQNERFYLRYGARPEQLFFAPYSIENDRFASGASEAIVSGKAAEIRSQLSLRQSDKLCLFVGKLIPRKRPLDVVRALEQLPKNVAVLFLGDGPLRVEVETELRRTGVLGKVVGFVNQSELAAYHAAADMLVLPSEQETWGLVANEAMACGKPVVVSDMVGSGYDLVADGPTDGGSSALTGATFSCRDIAGFARAISCVGDAIQCNPDSVRSAVLARISKYDVTQTASGLASAFVQEPKGR